MSEYQTVKSSTEPCAHRNPLTLSPCSKIAGHDGIHDDGTHTWDDVSRITEVDKTEVKHD